MADAKKKGRRSIEPKVKEQAMALLKEGNTTVKSIAEKTGVSAATIQNWKTGKSSYKPRKARTDSDVELVRLENEYLKKKLAYFESK